MEMNILLLVAPLPALMGSLFLMHTANVGSWVWRQQAVVSFFCLGACGFTLFKPREPFSEKTHLGFVLVALTLLVIPCLGSGEAPRRWIELTGFRLYVASAILPAALFFLDSLQRRRSSSAMRVAFLYVGMAAVLAFQPDAPQVMAFSTAAGLFFLMGSVSKTIKTTVIAGLAACVLWAWHQPDPLEPIPHVEGVLDLAWGLGPLIFIAAILGLALPILVLLTAGVAGYLPGLGIVAVYYLVICLLAWSTQLTPMPWLGFGAGPILGYFAIVYVGMRSKSCKVDT